MSTAGATTRPGLTPMPVMTVGAWAALVELTSGDLLVDLTAVWSLDVRGRQPGAECERCLRVRLAPGRRRRRVSGEFH
jgi:hypothetical protein